MEESLVSSPSSGRRPWLVGGLALVIVALGVGAFFAVRSFLRPTAATANAMPAETRAYASLDLLQLLDKDKLDRLSAVFKDSLAASNLQLDQTSVADQLDILLQDRFDFNFSADIAPWLGRSLGVGIVNLKEGAPGSPTPTAAILAAEVRDTAAADAFLQKLLAQIETDTGQTAAIATYDGIDYYQIGSGDEMVSFVRRARLMLAALGTDAMPLALDALRGDSLADNMDFKDVLAELPAERVITFFLSRDFFPQLFSLTGSQIETLPLDVALANVGLTELRGLAIGVGLTEPGITVDALTLLDPTVASPDRPSTAGSGAPAGLMPADTILFINSGSWNTLWQGVRRSMVAGASESDVAEAMQVFEQSVGFNPDNELFPHLTGELAVALAPSAQGLVAQGTGLRLSLLLSSGIDDAAALTTVGDKFQAHVAQLAGLPLFTRTTQGETTLYTADAAFSTLDLGYAVTADQFLVGTPSTAVEALVSADMARLADAPLYSRAQASLGAAPTFFLDLHGLLGILPAELSTPGTQLLTNVPMIAAAGANGPTGGAARWIIFLDTPTE